MKEKIIKKAAVYETNDYGIFKKMENNRCVSKKRLNRLIKSYSEKEILNPIVVNRNFEIVDGQGRYEAKKQLGTPIYFIFDEDADIDDCRRMNEYNAPWTTEEFVDSYAEEGKLDYIRLKKLRIEVKQPYSRLLRLANRGIKNKENDENTLKNGNLKFSDEDVIKVKNVLKLTEDICEALQVTKRLNDAFFTGVKVISDFEGYDHERMIKNCRANRSSYNQMSNLESQLKEFTRIYNYRVAKNKLYFEDYMRNRGCNVRTYDERSAFAQDMEDISTLERRS